jgi:hypothetical protein
MNTSHSPSGGSRFILARFSAVSGLLAGLCIALPGAVSIFTGKTAGAAFIIALSPALALPLLVAVYQRHASTAGRLGAVAYATALLGLGWFGGAVFTSDAVFPYLTKAVQDHLKHGPTLAALVGSALVFAVGSVLFGVFLLRSRAYPRVLAWAYIVFPTVLALGSPLPDSPLKNGVHVLAGTTIGWLAVTLWRANRLAIPAGTT